ncbi:hypothetical protein RM697_00305 [Ichthyenterobacterium sp. W332]|uniref:DinB family protein n=1 Tax=Microcosmobacter mediterraneus TaxID=3075607 RepID=A0ABU2YFV8_9FLAO|nr:hypothetical protein [Ichthyenterobacterium sp. W332]MDT0557064.1 hypothetical protein [Ichthyenterobacterium sp. W332]
MKLNNSIVIIALLFTISINAQKDKLLYYEIPEASENFTAGTVAARLVDGLGFRYHHASEGLTEKDLKFSPSEGARSAEETLQHIYDLSKIIVNACLHKPNNREKEALTYAQLRAKTLQNFKTAADILRSSDDISEFTLNFGDNKIPFWNNINGPIADAIWHAGQLATIRRMSGNPINSKVNHFNGTVRQ